MQSLGAPVDAAYASSATMDATIVSASVKAEITSAISARRSDKLDDLIENMARQNAMAASKIINIAEPKPASNTFLLNKESRFVLEKCLNLHLTDKSGKC